MLLHQAFFLGGAPKYTLEPLGEAHRRAVVDIFNIHVAQGRRTFFEEPVSTAFFDLLLRAVGDHPAQAATANGRLAGFSLLRPYHALPVFRRTAEISTFLAPEHMGKGLGTLLLAEMENLAKARRIDNLLAAIAADNAVSLRFHGKQGSNPQPCLVPICPNRRQTGQRSGRDLDAKNALKPQMSAREISLPWPGCNLENPGLT